MSFSNYLQQRSTHGIWICQFWQLTHAFTFVLAFLAFEETFSQKFSGFRWDEVITNLIFCTVTSVFIIASKYDMNSEDKKKKTPLLVRCRRDYTIGCIGTLLSAIIPLTLICFCGFSERINFHIYFASIVPSTVLYFVFIYPIESQCELSYKTSHVIICLVVYFFVIVPGFLWMMISDLKPSWVAGVAGRTYLFSLISCTMTLMSIAIHRLKVTNKEEDVYDKELEDLTTQERAEQRKASAPKLPAEKDVIRCSVVDETVSGETQKKKSIEIECEVCMQKYDASIENRVPRILIKCGHIMCHGCIQRIVVDTTHCTIFCPFCHQKTTVGGGKVEGLPKNFAILQMI